MNLCFAVHKLVNFSSNTGKGYIRGLLHLLKYIRDKNNLGLRYYTKIEDAPISDLLRKAIINNDKQLMMFHDYSYQECKYTGRSTGSYIVFYQGGPIGNFKHVPGTVAQQSDESEYHRACNSRMALAHFSMLKRVYEQGYRRGFIKSTSNYVI